MKTDERLTRIESLLSSIERVLPGLIRRDEMNARFDEVPTRTEMNARFDEVPTRAEMNARFDEVPTRAEMNERFAESARHAGVLFEQTQDRMQLLEEGLTARMDREGAETRALITSSYADLKALITAGYRDLDRRVTRFEERRG